MIALSVSTSYKVTAALAGTKTGTSFSCSDGIVLTLFLAQLWLVLKPQNITTMNSPVLQFVVWLDRCFHPLI